MRRRWISQKDARVWCPGGRWGPRRVRTHECLAILFAESVYTALIKEAAKGEKRLRPGSQGTVAFEIANRRLEATWLVKANAIWRFGRVFFQCSRCGGLCTRLYLPLADSQLGCRQCYGLSYISRTLQNYKDSIWGRGPFAGLLGTTQRDWAYMTTNERRKERRAKRAERQELRRRFVRRALKVRLAEP
jgi:hypothetical protein